MASIAKNHRTGTFGDVGRARRASCPLLACLAATLLGCASPRTVSTRPSRPDDAPAPPALDALASDFVRACAQSCMERNQMRAVAAEMIRAECETVCDEDWARPVIARVSDFDLQDTFRVRVVGRLVEAASETPSIVLIGGARVLVIDTPMSVRQSMPREGRQVIAAGTLILGAGPPRLEQVSVILDRGA